MKMLLFGITPFALALSAAPTAAQSHQHMPGMTTPATQPAPKPKARKAGPKPSGPARRPASAAPAPTPANGTGPPFMPSDAAASGDHADMPGMAMPPTPQESHGDHDMAAMPGMQEQESGTDLPPGDAAPPPVVPGRPADRFYDSRAMADAESALLDAHGGMAFSKVMLNLAEYQVRGGKDGYRWDGEFWIGGDLNRLVLKSEGEGSFGDRVDKAEVQALFSRALDPYWNLQLGARQDFEPKPARSYAVLGVEGLAPYWIETEAALFLSDKGDVLGRVTASYDQRITPRLILQPRIEANFSVQDMPRERIGAGVSDVELGLRLRYEIRREFAPYAGVSWERKLGSTADFARAAGENPGGISFVAGIRAWF